MTMRDQHNTIPAAKFKAQCLALLDRVAATGQRIIVTKRGKPVACIAPLPDDSPPSLEGSILYEKDLVSPIDVDWETNR